MLKAAKKDGRKDIITEYASLLYLDGFNIQGDFYALLKQTVPQGEWADFATKLSERVLSMTRKEKYADICSREGWTAKLFEYVKSEKSIHPMLKYEAQLIKDYSDEIAERYIKQVYWLMINSYNRNRTTYQEMCALLKRIVNMGKRERVEEVKTDLKKRYARCRALIEELGYV